MKKHTRRHRADGGDVSAMEMSQGKPAAVRSRNSSDTPAERLSKGHYQGERSGMNSRALSMGMPGGRRRFSTGGHATEMDFEPKGERLRKTRERNDILGRPHYAEGGKVHQGMRALYEALHSHFENEPQMKKLGASKEDVYEGEPHRYKRASGGHLWIQKAINPSKKGALHKALGVSPGKKIPMSKIEKAEHSKSPLLRKRANLAETLRSFHRVK